MAVETSYRAARANLAKLCDRVADDREIVLIRRRDREDVALISAEELSGLLETIHLLKSPKNRKRLDTALKRALAGKGRHQTVESLRREMGL
jgi:antitoxin YefM